MNTGLGGPAGYGENVFSSSAKAAGSNDDGSVAIDVTSVFSGGIDFYGSNYDTIYLNSNGTISFGTPFTDYQTNDLTAETTPMLAPFFADVNINSGGEIYWDIDPAAGTITMTWDSVAPYSGSGANSFQVVLTSDGNGDFTVEYIYEDIQWSGSGRDSADTGFTDGGANDTTLDGSNNATELQNYENADFGSGTNGLYTQSFSGGQPSATDGIVDGTGGNDTMDLGYADADGDIIDATGNLIYGQGGSDTVNGGDGADTIYGDGGGATVSSEILDWSAQGGDGTSVAAGFTQTTGEIDVAVSFASDGSNAATYNVETSESIYTESGEAFDPNSSLRLYGNGNGVTSTTTIDFSATTGSTVSDEVENLTFRIADIDWGSGNHTDILTINAYDADGNPVTVTITPEGGDTVSGNTITAEAVAEQIGTAGGSALIEIAGPVSSIEIIYENGQSGTQAVYVSDLHFDTVLAPAQSGDDSLSGGAGADEIYGEEGNDTLVGGTGADTMSGGAGADSFTIAEGDSVTGGDGDDIFTLADLGEAGSANITITGGEGDETAGDTLDFQGLIGWGDITYTDTDDANGGLSGYATLADGSVVNFSEIENVIICFTKGTRILTPMGPRPIEDLHPGDLVITADDGVQPVRWIGARTVPAKGRLAPIRIKPGGRFGNTRDLLVSPQHRMLLSGPVSNLMFGEHEVLASAKHLLNGDDVFQQQGGLVTYVHMMFDRHQIVFAEGAASESFHPGAQGLDAITGAARAELFNLFPQLRSNMGSYGDTSRLCLKQFEASLLAA